MTNSENETKSFPFIFILTFSICIALILGWPFGNTSGYGLITVWSNFCLGLSALLQIFSLIILILLIITSIWGWAFSVGKANELKIKNWSMKIVVEFIFTIFVCLAVLVFIFSSIGFGGVTLGSVLYLIANLGAFVMYVFFRGKGLIEKNGFLDEIEKIEPNDNSNKKKKKKENED